MSDKHSNSGFDQGSYSVGDRLLPQGWTYDSTNDNGHLTTVNGVNLMTLYGQTNLTKTISQTVNVNAEGGETLIVGGVAAAAAKSGYGNDHFFGIRAVLLDENGTEVQVQGTNDGESHMDIPFDSTVDMSLQFAARCIKVPRSGCAQIRFSFEYSNNYNTMMIADGFVYKAEFGDHYIYASEDGLLTDTYNDEGTAFQYEYDESSNISEITRTVSGNEETVAEIDYDNHNNPYTISNNVGTVITYGYDSQNNNGQVLSRTVTKDNVVYEEISMTYLQGGNYLATFTDADGGNTVFAYDDGVQITTGLVTAITDPNGNTSTLTYDEYTNELKEISGNASLSQSLSTEFTYQDDLLKSVRRGSMVYSYSYNDSNQITETKAGSQTLVTTSYDSLQRVSSLSFANGAIYTPTYNDNNQVIHDAWNNTASADYYYDANGRIVQLDDLENETTYRFEYALYDLPHRMIGSDGSNVMYRYDRAGQLSNLTYSKNDAILYSSNYHRDEKGQPEQVDIGLNYNSSGEPADVFSVHSNYDDLGRLTGQSNGKLVSEITYDTSNVSALQVTDDEGNLIADYSYDYDGNGNLLVSADDITGWSNTCTYDALNRPSTAIYTHGYDSPLTTNYTYEYNANGQLIAIKRGATTAYSYTYGNPSRPDLMTAFDAGYVNSSLSYDAYGNMTHFNGCTYTWKHGSLLESYTDDLNGNKWTYDYDIYGNCVRMVLTRYGVNLGEVTMEYADGLLIRRQETGDDPVFYAYDGTGAPVGFSYGEHFYSYAKNHLGDVLAIVEDTGDVVYRYGYDVFGNVYRSSGDMSFSTLNPYRAHGCFYDVVSGLSRVNGRYYCPQINAYVTPEPALTAGPKSVKSSQKSINSQILKVGTSEMNINWDMVANTVWPVSKSISLLLKPITDTVVADLSNQLLDAVKEKIDAPEDDFSRSSLGIGFTAVLSVGSQIMFTVLPPIESTFDYPTGLRHFMPVDMSFGAPWASYFLGFKLIDEEKMIYSSDVIHNMWQSRVGYTPTYDFFFSLGGPIFREKFEFEINNNSLLFPKTYYVVWIWKGDYWNLGAGAEIGIYKTLSRLRAEQHFYQVDTDETLDVLMKIDYRKDGTSGIPLYSAGSPATNWWVCVFCSQEQLPWVDWLDIEMKVKFNNPGLISPFYATYQSKNGNNDPDDDWDEITQILSPPFTGQELSGFHFQLNY